MTKIPRRKFLKITTVPAGAVEVESLPQSILVVPTQLRTRVLDLIVPLRHALLCTACFFVAATRFPCATVGAQPFAPGPAHIPTLLVTLLTLLMMNVLCAVRTARLCASGPLAWIAPFRSCGPLGMISRGPLRPVCTRRVEFSAAHAARRTTTTKTSTASGGVHCPASRHSMKTSAAGEAAASMKTPAASVVPLCYGDATACQ